MPSRKRKVGGARPGAGRPRLLNPRAIGREAMLTRDEAAAHDAARGDRPWSDWIRAAAQIAISLGSIRARAVDDGCTVTVVLCDQITGVTPSDALLDALPDECVNRMLALSPGEALRELVYPARL